jgi:putative transposase
LLAKNAGLAPGKVIIISQKCWFGARTWHAMPVLIRYFYLNDHRLRLFRKYYWHGVCPDDRMSYHERRSVRLKNYDYRSSALYFITICTKDRIKIFGEIKNGQVILNKYGISARQEWIKTAQIRANVELDAFIIMPDHIHGIIAIRNLKVDPDRGMAGHAPLTYSISVNRRFGHPIKKSLASIIGSYKASVSREINKLRQTPGQSVWHRNFYEHIIRNEKELYAVRKYIMNNPKKYK